MKSLARSIATAISVVSLTAALTVAYAQKPAAKHAAKPASKRAAKPVAYAAVEKTLKARCVGCHQGATPAGGVDLSSYDAITKAKFKDKPVVVAKNAKESVLIMALHGHGVAKMPPGPGLPAADIKAVEAWITAGAKK